MFEQQIEIPRFSLWYLDSKPKYRTERVKPNIIKIESVIDIALERMVKQVEASRDIIPNIAIKPIDIADLIERGLVAERSGQIRLGL